MEKIIDKIRKLLAKANGTNNEAEAAAFAAKAHELMMANEIGMDDVEEKEEERSVGRDYLDVKYGEPWRRILAAAVADYYLCTFVGSKAYDQKGKIRPRFIFVGRQSRTAVSKEMYLYLEATCVRLAKSFTKDRDAQLAFERGCGFGLSERLERLTKAAKEPPPVTGGAAEGSNLPALYSQALVEIQPVLAAMGIETKNVTVRGGVGFGAGRKAAEDVALNGQIKGGNGTAVRIG
jgi:Protein of unknown function (DUF2786)